MKLIPNARKVARKAWSARFLYVQIALFGAAQGLSDVWPQMTDMVSQRTMMWGGMALGVLALIGRFVLQPEVHDDE